MAEQKPAAKKAEEEEEDSVRLGMYLSYIKKELDNETACLELPFTIILLLSFSVLAYLHLKQADIYTVEGAVRFDIEENANFAWVHTFGHKTIADVNSIPDFWSWYRIGFLPLMVQHSWGYSESIQDAYDATAPAAAAEAPFDSASLPGSWGLPAEEPRSLPVRDDYLHYNRIIGGIRLRQERSQASWDLCSLPPNVPEDLWKTWLGKPCLAKNPNYELPPQIAQAEAFSVPEREEWMITAFDSVPELQRKAVDMEDGCSYLAEKRSTAPAGQEPNGGDGSCKCTTCSEGTGVVGPWLDELTERVEIGFVMYNFQYGLYSYVTCNFFFNRGGMIHKLVHVQSSWASPFTGSFWEVAVMLVCDCIWLLSLTYIFVQEVKEVFRIVQSSKGRWYATLWNDYIGLWNVVDWVSIFVAYFVVGCWIATFMETSQVNGHFEKIAAVNLADVNSTEAKAQYTEDIATFFDLTEGMVETEQLYRMSFMFYPMVVMLRLFKSFDAQPRLAVVTRTLVQATPDMIHFFIIFFSCYFCMAVNGVLLFGRDFVAFSSMSRSVITSFRVLFGEWDYDEMMKVGVLTCALWFWMFMLILFLLLLNILLAILMEAYAEVQQMAEDLTLPKQISEMVRRFRQTKRGDRVRLNDIWDAYFKSIGDEKDMTVCEPGPGFPDGQGGRQFITAKMIQEHVKRYMRLQVPTSQAKRGIGNAQAIDDAKYAQPYTVSNVHGDLDRLNTLTRDVRHQVRHSFDIMARYDFDEDDEQFLSSVPDDVGEECTEQRQLVADAVSGAVSMLTSEISQTLVKEATFFEKRQKHLELSQAEMVACAKDACTHLGLLRERTDEVVGSLQRLVIARQRGHVATSAKTLAAAVFGAFGGGGTGSALAGCGAPDRGHISSV